MGENNFSPSNPVILVLGTRLGIVSGVSTHLQQLFQSSLKEKYQFVHFEVGGQGKQENLPAKLQRFISSPLSLWWKIKTINPDIVHFNTSIDAKAFWRDAVYFYVVRMLKKKTVYQVHGGASPELFFRGNKLLNMFLRHFLTLPDVIVVLAYREQEALFRFCRAPQVRVIPNAIDLGSYGGALQKNFHGKRLNLVYIGALTPGKGLPETIEALGILKKLKVNRTFSYRVAGSGPLEDSLKKRTDELGLNDTVQFLGPLFDQDKMKFWMDAHIFVFPSHSEGLSYTLLESLAAGTPVITTDVGAIPEVLTDRVHGILVNPGDIDGLVDALRQFLSDPGRLKTMSLSCIKRAHEYFGIQRLVEQFDQLYHLLAKGEGREE